MSSYKNQAVSGFFWRFCERLGGQCVTFFVTVLLARLLEPELFGVIALVTVFTSLLQVFVDSGLGVALIQKKDADDLDFSTVFYFNIAMCFALYFAMFFFAPGIARFFENPSLTSIIRVLSLTIIISGVNNVQQAYVSRSLRFKKLFFATLWGKIGSAAVGIVMAYAGYGVWALVGQQLFCAIIGVVVLWATVEWRPKLFFSFNRLKGLLSYGWKLLISSLAVAVYQDLRQLIIGKMYTPGDLAYYNRGSQLVWFVIGCITSSLDSVLLPTMSKVQDDRFRVKLMTRRAIKACSYFLAPALIGLAVCAESFISLIFTDKWLECVPYLRIHCLALIFFPIHSANMNALKALGRSDLFMKLEIIHKIVGLVAILATMRISVLAIAYGLLASAIWSLFIDVIPNAKLLKYNWFEQMRDILPNIGVALMMGAVVYFVGWLPAPTLVTLALQVVVGAVVYVALSAAFKLEIFYYLLETTKDLVKRKKSA